MAAARKWASKTTEEELEGEKFKAKMVAGWLRSSTIHQRNAAGFGEIMKNSQQGEDVFQTKRSDDSR